MVAARLVRSIALGLAMLADWVDPPQQVEDDPLRAARAIVATVLLMLPVWVLAAALWRACQ